jgi:hypothetical protein
MNRTAWITLIVAFLALMAIMGLTVREAFGGQPGTQIQMNASRPVVFVAPAYSP